MTSETGKLQQLNSAPAWLFRYAYNGLGFIVLGSFLYFLLFTDLPGGLTETTCGPLTCWPLKLINFLDHGRAESYWNADVATFVLRLKYWLVVHCLCGSLSSAALSLLILRYVPESLYRPHIALPWSVIQFCLGAALLLSIWIIATLDDDYVQMYVKQGSDMKATKRPLVTLSMLIAYCSAWLPWQLLLHRHLKLSSDKKGGRR